MTPSTALPPHWTVTARRAAPLSGLALVLLASYALVRPAADALFLDAYTHEGLPYAWLAVAVAAVGASMLYVRAVARYPLPRVLAWLAVGSAAGIVVLGAAISLSVPGAPFVLYLWKDLHIVLLLETFWAAANASFGVSSARWVYGLFCVAGSIGGITFDLLVPSISARYGTLWTLLGSVPLLVVFGVLSTRISVPGGPSPRRDAPVVPMAAQARRLLSSRYLLLLAAVITCVQLVVTLVDKTFSASVQATFSSTDDRTAAFSAVYLWIDVGSAALQLTSGFLFRYVGIGGVLFAIPVAIATSLFGIVTSGAYASAMAAKVIGKACDYSLFRAAKEILYIPLDYAEKTEGKGLVDILAYRVSKGGASLLLLGLGALGAAAEGPWVALGLTGVWLALTVPLVRLFRRRQLERAADGGA